MTPSVFVARALVVRAMRKAGLHHVLQSAPCMIGIVGVDEGTVDAVSSAARHVMGAWIVGNFGFDVVIYDRTEDRRRRQSSVRSIILDAAKAGQRGAMLFTAIEDVPLAFFASAEGVAVLDPVDRCVVRGAFMAMTKRAPDPAGLDLVASLPLDLLDSVIVAGRSVERSVGVARKLLAALATDPEPVEQTHHEVSEEPKTTGPSLADLAGLGAVAEWGEDLARDLADYRNGSLPWADVDKGVLVSGPPGVGKTMFAQALGVSCAVPVLLHSCARWQAKGHLGDLLKAMGKAFDEARKAAPCILFLDEMDAFGSRAEHLDHNAAYARQVIDGLLEQLDGAQGREGVVVVGATNNPELIDDAILRPGRMDRVIAMKLPDAAGRVGILRHHLRGDLETADLQSVSERLDGCSGAVIELLVRDARRRARKRREPMAVGDLEQALPPERQMSDALFRRVCVHEAAHFVVGLRLADEAGSDPTEAMVDRRMINGAAGFTRFSSRPGFDRTRASYLAEVTVLLAGSAAEEEFIGVRGDGSGGAEGSDLARATIIAAAIETSLGLGEGLVHLAGNAEEAVAAMVRDPALRERVGVVLDECLARARGIVVAERKTVERVAAVLAAEGRAEPEPSRLERVMEGRL